MVVDGKFTPLCKKLGGWEKDKNKKNQFRLPYSTGQKYTFGNKFTSREEQGEFIFLPGDHLGKLENDDVLCEIVCEEDKYWVSSQGANKILVNDEEIVGSTRKELAFGDYLSFVESGNERIYLSPNSYSGGPKQLRFLFQKWRLTLSQALVDKNHEPGTVEHEEGKLEVPEVIQEINSNFLVGQNELIISKILSYLPLKTVKNARFVSKIWNKEASQVIKTRSRVTFQISNYNNVQTSMNLFLFSHDLRDNPGLLQKLKFLLPPFDSNYTGWREGLGTKDGENGHKFTSDIHRFLGQGHTVTELNLNGPIVYSQKDFDIQITILEALQGSLQKLELSGYWHKNNLGGEHLYSSFNFPATLQFPKLQSFTWSIRDEAYSQELIDKYNCISDYHDYNDEYYDYPMDFNSSNFDWIYDLIQAVAGVRELRIHCDPKLATFFMRKLDSFTNLEELSLKYDINPELKLNLLKIQRPLKKLVWDELAQEDVSVFEELLQKHCNTLESLQFSLPHKGLPQVNYGTIRIHALPTLKSLAIYSYGYCCGDRNVKFGEAGDTPGLIEYAQHFPSLRSLVLEDDEPEFLQCFFPFYNKAKEQDQGLQDLETRQICRTLEYLDFRSKYEKFVITKVDEVDDMFPNLRNDWKKNIMAEGWRYWMS